MRECKAMVMVTSGGDVCSHAVRVQLPQFLTPATNAE